MANNNIMLDLETMGTTPNSAIIAIGAVRFNEDGINGVFYKVIDLQSCLDKGMDITGETIKWWMQQSDEARGEFKREGVKLKDALIEFKNWIDKDAFVWGNGAGFDNVMLANAYSKFKVSEPWMYYNNRCFRTLAATLPKINMSDVETVKHNALADAKWQAKYLIRLVKKNKLRIL